jgi:DNA-binding beta-propeller fold protein YncE
VGVGSTVPGTSREPTAANVRWSSGCPSKSNSLFADSGITGYGDARVLKLPAGSITQVKLPFTGFTGPKPPNGVAVNSAGDVYVVDSLHQRVVELPAGSTTQVELSFGAGLGNPWGGVAVDSADNIYVADNYRVLKLPAR